MENNEIKVTEFITERESDIRILEKAINLTRKKTMLFQRLPFYARRRTRSNFVSKKKSTRRKDRNFLRTHVWYAKRYKMIKLGKMSLPLSRNQKSSKFIYKSQKRGFVFDESYKKTYILDLESDSLTDYQINYSVKNIIQLVKTEYGFIEVVVTQSYVLLIIPILYNISYENTIQLDCCISLIKVDKKLLNGISDDIEDSLEKNSTFYVKNSNEYEIGKLFINSKDMMNTWINFIKMGCIPVCIEELQRIALENDYMFYPFDDVNSDMYKIYEEIQNQEIIEKYERTPKSKKVAVDFNNLKIYTTEKCYYYIFELDKGVLSKNGYIFDNECQNIGRVIRGYFSFTNGKSRGLCYTFIPVDFTILYDCKNCNHSNMYKLRIIKKLN